MKAITIASLAIASLVCVVLVAGDEQEQADPGSKATAELAREIVREIETAIHNGDKRFSGEELYTWSRRLAEDERAATTDSKSKQMAVSDHAKRMTALEARIRELHNTTNGATLVELYAARYYRAKAVEWAKSSQ